MTTALVPGFADPVHAAQRSFRRLLTALSEPGRVLSLSDAAFGVPGLGPAMAAVALTLLDGDCAVWCDPVASAARPWIAFHTGAPMAGRAEDAAFALVGAAANLLPLDRFAVGSDPFPDRSTTIIVEVAGLAEGNGLTLSGPGIDDRRPLAIDGLPDGFLPAWTANRALFPRGVDLVLTSGPRLCGLPRSTTIGG